MIRLISSDIDGTLTKDGGHRLNPEYFEVIRALREKGVYFCASSGRHITGMVDLFGPVSDDIYYICESGGLLRTADRILKSWTLPEGMYQDLLSEVRSMPDVDLMVDTADCIYVESGEDSNLYRFIHDGYRFRVQNIEDLSVVPESEILKVAIYSDILVDQSCASFLNSDWVNRLTVAQAGTMWVDATAPGASKGTALKELRERLGISREETVYFGDNVNDLSAFAEAGTAVTVENAREEVKAQADRVVPSHEEGGVLRELKRILAEMDG